MKGNGKRSLLWVLLGVGAVLAACLACALLAAAAFLLPTRRVGLPVTGGSAPGLPPLPTSTPHDLGYGAEARLRLDACSAAFHTLFLVDEASSGDPSMATALEQALDDFLESCVPLGSLPEAPLRYQVADQWLKLAAAEIDAASDLMRAGVHEQQGLIYGQAAEHLNRFIEYIILAENALSGMEDFKEASVE